MENHAQQSINYGETGKETGQGKRRKWRQYGKTTNGTRKPLGFMPKTR
jgi:hypothetical protein